MNLFDVGVPGEPLDNGSYDLRIGVTGTDGAAARAVRRSEAGPAPVSGGTGRRTARNSPFGDVRSTITCK